eukprot:4142062-Pyramimonas_sp.AAC.1
MVLFGPLSGIRSGPRGSQLSAPKRAWWIRTGLEEGFGMAEKAPGRTSERSIPAAFRTILFGAFPGTLRLSLGSSSGARRTSGEPLGPSWGYLERVGAFW